MSFLSVPGGPLIQGDANFSSISTGIINIHGKNIVNVGAPISSSDAANKSYVDVQITTQGLPPGGTTGQVLTKIDDTDYNVEWAMGGGGGTPGGLNTQVQYNSGGSFAGSALLTWDSNILTAPEFSDGAGSTITGGIVTASSLVSVIPTGVAPLVVSSTTLVPNLYVNRAQLSDSLGTTSSPVVVNIASPPSTGQVLTATSPTTATWQFASVIGAPLTEVNDTNITLTLGGSPSTALFQATSITAGWAGTLAPTRGGTGVNNASSTLTLGGSLTTSGPYTSTLTMTGPTSVTLPTSGTLATTSQIPTGAALTEVNDTNITLTLGGSPSTSLLQPTSITAGWAGTLAPTRGGTGVNNASNTLTLGGSLTTSGPYTSTLTMTGPTTVTLPTSGTLATTSQIPTGAPLTEVNDTNITLTLGGSPSTALIQATSITAGWAGTLAPTRGGTGVNNASSTLTLGGSLTTSGAYTSTLTMTGPTSVTLPTSGTLATNSLPNGNILVGNASNTAIPVAMNGDVNITNTGSTTIQAGVVSNPKLAEAGAHTWKGNNSAVLANVSDNPTGTLSENVSSILTITGSQSLLNNTTIQVSQANTSTSGYLGSTDWNTFNNKQNLVSSPVNGNILIDSVTGQAIDSGVDISADATFSSASNYQVPTALAVQTYVNNAITGGSSFRGGYNASTNLFPSTGGSGGGGTIEAGNYWLITVAGTLGGMPVVPGNTITALVTTPGQTSSNWFISASNVSSVNGQTGAVSLGISNMNDVTEAGLANGQLLIWNATTGKWVNSNITATSPTTGVTVTNSAGGIALNTAQPIGTSSTPTFVSVNLTSLSGQINSNSKLFTIPQTANSNAVIPTTATSKNFLTGITSGGIVFYSQPALAGLSDVSVSALSNAQVLIYNGSNWVNNSLSGAINVTNAGVTSLVATSNSSLTTLSGLTTASLLASVGTITTGIWQGSLISPTWGGTGVNNASNTLTLGGSLTTAGAYTSTLTMTGPTIVTLPTSGTLLNNTLTTGHIYVGTAGVATDTQMSGDATIASGGALTLATVNTNTGSWGSATQVPQFTVNGKGLITAASNITITGTSPVGSSLASGDIWVGNASNIAQPVVMSGDATISNIGSLTLTTVNSTSGSTSLSTITTNAKGLVTSNTTGNLTGDITSTGLATTYNNTVPLTKGGTSASLTASNGGIFYSTASQGAILAGTSTAGQMLLSGATSAPSWSTNMTYTGGSVLNLAGTTASTSSTTGVLTLAGGIGISNTTDATSTTNGGSLTTAGGAAIAKSLWVGTDIVCDLIYGNSGSSSIYPTNNYASFGSNTYAGASNIYVGNSPGITSVEIDSWVASTPLSTATFVGVTYHKYQGLFVAIANGGTSGTQMIFTSPDANTWTAHSSLTTRLWTSICFSNFFGSMAAVASDGTTANQLICSNDGQTWTAATSPAPIAWSALSVSSNLQTNIYVGVANVTGTTSCVMWTNNGGGGGTWAMGTGVSATTLGWTSVCWSDYLQIFVAVGGSTVPATSAMWSTDGKNWFQATTGVVAGSGFTWTSVCWSNSFNYFVAVNNSGTTSCVMYSTDGKNWTATTGLAVTGGWKSICFNNSFNIYVAVGGSATNGAVMYASGPGPFSSATSSPTSIITSHAWSAIYPGPSGGNVPFVAVSSTASTGNSMRTILPTGYNANIAIGTQGMSNMYLYGNNINIGLSGTNTYVNGLLQLQESSQLVITNETISSQTNVGAVLLFGGMSIINSTDATSATNGGTFTTAGGMAIAKQLYVGTTLNVPTISNLATINSPTNLYIYTPSGYTQTSSGFNAVGPIYSYDYIQVASTAPFFRLSGISTNFFDFAVSGGPGQYSALSQTGDGVIRNTSSTNNNNIIIDCVNTTGSIILGTDGINRLNINQSGIVNIPGTTASTSNTTGILTLAGGIGISNTTDATSATNGGSLTTAGGAAIAESLWVGTTVNAGNSVITGSSSQSEWLVTDRLGSWGGEILAISNNVILMTNLNIPRVSVYIQTSIVTGTAWINYANISPSDNIGTSSFGSSISVVTSGTTYTAIICGPQDNSGYGAAWIYQSTDGQGATWTEVVKLIPTGGIGTPNIGLVGNVSLTYSGSTYTAIIGGPQDNSNIGAAWIFQSTTGGGSSWTQITKIVPPSTGGNAYIGTPSFGTPSLVINGSTYTAIISGYGDNSGIGASWIYQNTTGGTGTWSLITKIVPPSTGPNAYIGQPAFGFNTSTGILAVNGSTLTAAIGGYEDNNNLGAVWIYQSTTGGGSGWTLITKIVPGNVIGSSAKFGCSVQLYYSGTSYTFAVGGFIDNNTVNAGAAWIYTSTSGTSWTQQNKMTTELIGFGFGISVGIYGNTVCIGSLSSIGVMVYTYASDTLTIGYGVVNAPGNITAHLLTDSVGTTISDGEVISYTLSTLLNLPSNSSTTGSIISAGGIGINNSIDALSATNGGSLTTAGGMAVAKSLWVGTSLNVGTGINLDAGQLLIDTTTASTSATTGAMVINGGIGINNATDATSTTDGGSLTTAGGMAVAKSLWVGTNLSITGTSSVLSLTGTSSQIIVSGTADAPLTISYLVVAGGGGGGDGAGGGAGGMLTGTKSLEGSYIITVGAGGGPGYSNGTYYPGQNGGNSSIGTLVVATGGGVGDENTYPPGNGGSGGGSVLGHSPGTGIAGQGYAGGTSTTTANSGGGGAGAPGSPATINNVGSAGGVGLASSISGSTIYYAGGGGGGGNIGGSGGNGGGGAGAAYNLSQLIGGSGTPNTGGGGGGSVTIVNSTSGSGGSGIVIISYSGTTPLATGGTITYSGGQVIHTFTSSGTFNITQASISTVGSVSVGKSLYVETNETLFGASSVLSLTGTSSQISVSSTTSSTNSGGGSIITAGGIGISNTTDASSATNGGTITTAGGVGIAKQLYVGSTTNLTQALNMGNGYTAVCNGQGMYINIGSGTFTASNANPSTFNQVSLSQTTVNGTGTTALANTLFIGGPPVAGTLGITSAFSIYVNSGSCVFAGGTASTSSNTGQILVGGGIGISQTTDALSATNGGTITTAGGVGIAKSLWVGTDAHITGQTYCAQYGLTNSPVLIVEGVLQGYGSSVWSNSANTGLQIGWNNNAGSGGTDFLANLQGGGGPAFNYWYTNNSNTTPVQVLSVGPGGTINYIRPGGTAFFHANSGTVATGPINTTTVFVPTTLVYGLLYNGTSGYDLSVGYFFPPITGFYKLELGYAITNATHYAGTAYIELTLGAGTTIYTQGLLGNNIGYICFYSFLYSYESYYWSYNMNYSGTFSYIQITYTLISAS